MIDVRVVAGVIRHDGAILAAKRKNGGPAGLKWEFPGGKVEANESPQGALRREIMEELELDVQVVDFLGTHSTVVGSHRINLECFWCDALSQEFKLHRHVEAGWYPPQTLNLLD